MSLIDRIFHILMQKVSEVDIFENYLFQSGDSLKVTIGISETLTQTHDYLNLGPQKCLLQSIKCKKCDFLRKCSFLGGQCLKVVFFAKNQGFKKLILNSSFQGKDCKTVPIFDSKVSKYALSIVILAILKSNKMN